MDISGNIYYWTFLLFAIVGGLSFIYFLSQNRSLSYFFTLLEVVIIGFIGSVLVAFIEYIAINETIIFSQISLGERFSGALLLSIIYIIYLNISKYNTAVISISVCIFAVFGKIGCFLSQHYGCYGIPTDLPWGKIFNDGVTNSVVPVHPVQIYDAIAYGFIFSFISFLFFVKNRRDNIFNIAIFSISLYGILIESIKTNPNIIFSLTINQVVYIFIVLISLYLFVAEEKALKK